MPCEPLDPFGPICHALAMSFWVYILRCSDGSFYTGHTDALEHRIGQHQHGWGGDYTSRRRPVTFVWMQEFAARAEALAAERQIKGWSRAKKEAMIAGDWARVSRLAVARGTRPSTGSGRTVESGERADRTARPELVEGRFQSDTAR